MYKITLEVQLKQDVTRKESYEKIAKLIRVFINQNDKELKKTHYEKNFSYYTFSNMFPFESDSVYKKGGVYTIELRSIKKEFLDFKTFKGLETPEMVVVDVSGGKLYYGGNGKLSSETPVFFNTKKINDKAYERQVKDKIRENIIFRYVKSGMNSNDDLDHLRQHVIEDIHINPKVVTIPFEEKKLKNGNSLLYHCFNVEVVFQDNPLSKEVEKVIYSSGLGLNTSNGFGFMTS